MLTDGKTPPRKRMFSSASLHAQVIFVSAVINTAALAMPLAVLQVYDRIIPNQSKDTALVLFAGVSVALLAETLLRLARTHIVGRLGARFEAMMFRRAMAHLFSTELKDFEAQPSGVHMERLNAIGSLRDHASGQALLALYDVPFAVIYLVLIFYFGGPLLAVTLAGLLAMTLITMAASRSSRPHLSGVAGGEDERSSFVISLFSGIQSVKAMALELPLLRRYESLQERRLDAHRQADLNAQHTLEAGQLVVQLTSLATVAFGSLLVLDGRLTVGGLGACTLLTGRALAPVQSLISMWSRRQSMAVAREKLTELFSMPQEGMATGRSDATDAAPHLTLDGVSFGFNPEAPVLHSIDLDLRQGELVALVGPNGGGKSTLLSVMAGLYHPTSGHMLLDGQPIESYAPATLRSLIALLPHQETLFRGTILENITMFRPAMEPAAMAAAERVGIVELIHSMPHGFATIVGDGATEPLPRGLAQRIAIARALVEKPRVILFDDANSAADDRGDASLSALLDSLRTECAVLFVSHRPAILKKADRIYRLSDGHLDRTSELAA